MLFNNSINKYLNFCFKLFISLLKIINQKLFIKNCLLKIIYQELFIKIFLSKVVYQVLKFIDQNLLIKIY